MAAVDLKTRAAGQWIAGSKDRHISLFMLGKASGRYVAAGCGTADFHLETLTEKEIWFKSAAPSYFVLRHSLHTMKRGGIIQIPSAEAQIPSNPSLSRSAKITLRVDKYTLPLPVVSASLAHSPWRDFPGTGLLESPEHVKEGQGTAGCCQERGCSPVYLEARGWSLMSRRTSLRCRTSRGTIVNIRYLETPYHAARLPWDDGTILATTMQFPN
ncbi:hypothetical protein B0H19DRAFT_1069605 [Mycena capillaripes]|nr:hypothetical protein B0H19DRAFT_1069605 [Mycena capillaripes]